MRLHGSFIASPGRELVNIDNINTIEISEINLFIKRVHQLASNFHAGQAGKIPEKYRELLTKIEEGPFFTTVAALGAATQEAGLVIFHDMGQIIFHKRSGIVISNPQVFAKIVSLFVGPEAHTDNLLGYIGGDRKATFALEEIVPLLDGLFRRMAFMKVPDTLIQ